MTIRDVEDAVPYGVFAYISVIYGTSRTPSPTVAFCLYIRDLRNAEDGVPYDRFRLRIKKARTPEGHPYNGAFCTF